MGTTRWAPEDWDNYASMVAHKSAAELFASRTMCADLDPNNIAFRESCDSAANPNSTPIIVAVDDTGSMGMLAEVVIRKGLGVLMEEIIERKPVSDPHVMFMAVGDAYYDRAPLQVTQFETDIRLAEQLSRFFIEGGGGGNNFESYNLPWYFAATKTKCDAFLKRQKKGYLFTVGDEPPPPTLLAAHVEKFLGGGLQKDMSSRDLLNLASKQWEIFHIMIEEGSHYRGHPKETKNAWQKLLGQRAIPLSDHKKLAELVVSTIQLNEGASLSGVASSWSGGTALVVRNSLNALAHSTSSSKGGITRFW